MTQGTRTPTDDLAGGAVLYSCTEESESKGNTGRMCPGPLLVPQGTTLLFLCSSGIHTSSHLCQNRTGLVPTLCSSVFQEGQKRLAFQEGEEGLPCPSHLRALTERPSRTAQGTGRSLQSGAYVSQRPHACTPLMTARLCGTRRDRPPETHLPQGKISRKPDPKVQWHS